MVLNRAWSAAAGAIILSVAVLTSSGLAAQQYRPDEFLTLDLSKAVLSPKPLGPVASFAPGPPDVTVGRSNNAAQANAELRSDSTSVAASPVRPESRSAANAEPATDTATPHARWAAHALPARPTLHKPRTLVALHGRNPVEAQARDTSGQPETRIQQTRIHTWPCKSGGICDWKR